MLFKAFRALSSGARDRGDRVLDDPYLDRPTAQRRATGPDAGQQRLQDPPQLDGLYISESDSDEYGLPQVRKSTFPRHDPHRRNMSREQADIEYKCQGCGEQYRIGATEQLQPCKYCHVRPLDPRRHAHGRPQFGPLPNRQIRTPASLEDSFRSLYRRLGIILHEEHMDQRLSPSPQQQLLASNEESGPLLSSSPPKAAQSHRTSPRPTQLEPPWSPKKASVGNEPVSRTPPTRIPPPIPPARNGPPGAQITNFGMKPPRNTTTRENGFLATPHHANRPSSRGSPMVGTPMSTSPRKRPNRAPPIVDGSKAPASPMFSDHKSRAKLQLIESFRSDFTTLYGNTEFLNNDFCSTVRPKINKRSLSEGSNISLASLEENATRPLGITRHDSAKPNAIRFGQHNICRPTPLLQPAIPDGKALLAGHLHDVVSSIADYHEIRRVERSTTVARKSTYQTSPHVNYSELHAYHSILTRFTLDVTFCMSLITRDDDSAGKTAEMKDEIVQFAAQLLACCLEVLLELLVSPQEAPSSPQGVRYLLLALITPWMLRPLTPLATEYRQWHNAQIGSSSQVMAGRYGEAASLLLLQPSQSKKARYSLRDQIMHVCMGRLSNLPETVQQVFPRWFANMPVNTYIELTRAVQEMNIKSIRSVPVQEQRTDEKVKKLHDRRFLSEMIGAAHIDHFDNESDNIPWYTKRKSAWRLRTSCHSLQLLVVANDIRCDTAARYYSSQPGQIRASDDTYMPFPVDYFYTPLLDPEAGRLDIALDFELWDSKKNKFTMCQYPFLLTLGTKARILEYDNERRKKDAVRQEWHTSKGMSADPYFHLIVRREHIIEDSFKAIRQAVGSMSNVTSKKLRVHFDGEEAVDAGGPQKEWFLVLTQKLFSPELGLFYVSDSGDYWFHTACNRPNEYYELVGAVFGLAIYNQTPLFAPFPPFLFKKLAAAAPRQGSAGVSWRHVWRPTLQDFAQLSPDVAKVMKDALADPSIMAGLNFEIPLWRNGKSEYVPLVPEGSAKEITGANIHEFVERAVTFVLKESISMQFIAFARGFHSICGGNALSLFRGEELELLVRGSEDFDLDTLRAAAVYDNWKRSNTKEDLQSEDDVSRAYPVLRFFWSFFSRAPIEQRRRILQFITGTDRLPPAGIVNLVIKVSRQVTEQGEFRYPSARTCFNQILLPDCFGEGEQNKFDKVFGNALDMAGTGFGMR